MEVKGLPPADVLEAATRRKVFFSSNNLPRVTDTSTGVRRVVGSKSLATVLNCDDHLFLNFLASCLRWHPKDRFTPVQALQHPWILQVTKKSFLFL
jgi:dual specificity tyrosine-phosphorylation-regulated kinase 2/3/4